MLKNLYGKVILQKDSILYHTKSHDDLSERGPDGGAYDSTSQELFIKYIIILKVILIE